MKRLLLIISLLFFQPLFAADKILNVYNWARYMPNSIILQFERETGIKVNYLEFDSNETLYAKLKTDPNAGFDVIVPSSYYVKRMAREGMLHQLDHEKILGMKYFNPYLLNREFDPHNQYSLPYAWGMTGIAVNDQYHNPNDFNQWQDLWNPVYKDQLLMLDDMREAFGIALFTLGYSLNDTNPEHIKQAYEKLRQLMPNIKLFNSDAEQNIYVDEDATLGMGWNGDIFQSQRENPHIKFVFPKPYFSMWIDCVAIVKNAPHLENAYKFINFINRPDIAAQIAITNGYSSPNTLAVKLLPRAMRNSPVLNPSPETLRRSIIMSDVGPADAIYEKYWALLKLGS